MKRREFMSSVAASAAWMLTSKAWQPAHAVTTSAILPRRPLGTTGITLPIFGFSGLVARDNSPGGVDRAVAESLELGIDYFDTAASYGNSETMLAPVLKPRRNDVILATKTRERTRDGAAEEFRRSCEILGTDYFDMFLVHGIQDVAKDVDAAFAPGGAMEFLLDKKKEGSIRLLGFSSHSTESALAAMDRYDFDFFYFPVNYVSYYKGNFGPEVLATAKQKGIPCVALKALARQHWPESVPKESRCKKCWYQPIDDPHEASLALRWSLSQGVVSILPPGNEELYDRALALRDNLDPITPEETAALQAMANDQTPLFPR